MAERMGKSDGPDKDALRLARFLMRGPARLKAAADERSLLVEREDKGVISVRCKSFRAMLRDGQVMMDQDTVALSREGAARMARMGAERGDVYGAQHRDLARQTRMTNEGDREPVLVNLAESPLSQLANRRNRKGEPFLARREFMAGERLRGDFTRGQLMQRLGVDWDGAIGSSRGNGAAGGMADLTDAALAARRRVENALTAAGPELSGILIDVCCFLKGLENVEMERGWPVRSAKVVLKTALAALARHYEPPTGSGPSNRRGIVHWGTNDFRPLVNGG